MFIFSSITTALLLTLGLLLTFKTKAIYIKSFPIMIIATLKSDKLRNKECIRSMLLSLGGSVGIGNIVGVATAINAGGPGSLIWMWICGAFGMIIKYAEVYISVNNNSGKFAYIVVSFKKYGQAAAKVFAVFTVIASLTVGNALQIKYSVEALSEALSINPIFPLILFIAPTMFLINGKTKRILDFSSVTVPIMSVVYICLTVFIIIKNIQVLPITLLAALKSAIGYGGASVGFSAYILSRTISEGITKGLFSHEAGMGTAPISYCSSYINDAKASANFASIEVYVDTFIISTLTALAVLVTNNNVYSGTAATLNMFNMTFGGFGRILLAIMIYLFAVSSIAGWIFYGKYAVEFLTKKNIIKNKYNLMFIIVAVLSPYIDDLFIWNITNVALAVLTAINSVPIIKNIKIIYKSFGGNNVGYKMHGMCKKMQCYKKRRKW